MRNLLRRFQNWLANLATQTPGVERLLTRAGRAIEEAQLIKEDSKVEALLSEELQYQRMVLKSRMSEMLSMREAELACYQPAKYAELHEAGRVGGAVTETNFKERLWELELALEDRGWVRETTMAALEFSRYGVQQLVKITRIYSIKNPIVKRGAEICALYVFGRGLEIRSEDDAEDKVIQAFLQSNQQEMGHTGLAQKEQSIQTDGSLYFALKTNVDGTVTVQMIDPLEVLDVICDPDNPTKPMYFYRQWLRENFTPADGRVTPDQKTAYYPALEMIESGETLLTTIAGIPVNKDMPIMRVKIGAPAGWRWGIPPLYASIDWARAYKDLLEDWATIQRMLARFSLMVETKGGSGAIAAYQALLSTTFADSGGTTIERNPPPVAGSAHVSGPGNKIEPFKTAGTQTNPEQGRRILLMAAAAQGMPETFYGDASVGALATALSLDRPTELKFKEIQQRWSQNGVRILAYVIKMSRVAPTGTLREAALQKKAPGKLVWKFPAVLEHDVQKTVQAWIELFTGGSKTGSAAGLIDRKTVTVNVLEELGQENANEIGEEIFGSDYDRQADVEDQVSKSLEPAPAPMPPGGAPIPKDPAVKKPVNGSV